MRGVFFFCFDNMEKLYKWKEMERAMLARWLRLRDAKGLSMSP